MLHLKPADAPATPVAAAIAKHHLAWERLGETASAADDTTVRLAGGDVSPRAMAPAKMAYGRATRAETRAWLALLKYRPASLAELAQMARYVVGAPAWHEIALDEDDVLGHVTAAIEALAAAAARPDLDALEAEFEAAYAAETKAFAALYGQHTEEDRDRASDCQGVTAAVVRRIEQVSVIDMRTARLWARAICWCEGIPSTDHHVEKHFERGHTSGRMRARLFQQLTFPKIAPAAFSAAAVVQSDAEAACLAAAIENEWAAQIRPAAADYGDPSDEAEARVEARYARRLALLSVAEKLPATSREAARAKALALAWIAWTSLHRPGEPRESGEYATDGRLGFDIETSLVAATGV